MDINIDLYVLDVPDEKTADRIAADIQTMLLEKHGTDIAIIWDEV